MDGSDAPHRVAGFEDREMPGREFLRRARVADYARQPAITVSPDLGVSELAELFHREQVSGAPVASPAGTALGVVSLTDLIALALFGAHFSTVATAPDDDTGPVPDVRRYGHHAVRDIMTPAVWSAKPREPLAVAAERLLDARVHRLVVVGPHGSVEGLLSTVDLMRAVRDARLATPIRAHATRETESVEVGTPVSRVMRRLLEAGFTGMPVTDNGWPIGFVSQAELLRARDRTASTPVEEIASPAMLCLPERTPLWSAAEEALRQGTRRILVVRARQVRGILTSVDFARAMTRATAGAAAR
jgi:CBS domain-containing protein